ncbi:Transcriptional regulator, GntR-family (fragment) [Cupriavidus taiwanensis]|uniref:Transcriptional regulator, GntR-family n=1 Tax=Cupriavidus taiwanensis TaxID=164546 RepID=A0A375IDE3_9BURK
MLRLSRHKSLKLPGRIQESCAEHLSVFAALKARDPEGAEAMMKSHLLRQRGALRALDAGGAAMAADAKAVRAPPALRVAGAED